jgi:hypothetical protein
MVAWVKVELYGANNDGSPRRYTIADATAVSKGTLLALSTPRTATVAAAASVTYAGVASEEHPASAGITSIAAWTDGIFRAVASDAVVAGQPVTGGATDQIYKGQAGTVLSGAALLGYAMEDIAAAGTGAIRLKL